jgi:hypothetical protein
MKLLAAGERKIVDSPVFHNRGAAPCAPGYHGR